MKLLVNDICIKIQERPFIVSIGFIQSLNSTDLGVLGVTEISSTTLFCASVRKISNIQIKMMNKITEHYKDKSPKMICIPPELYSQ